MYLNIMFLIRLLKKAWTEIIASRGKKTWNPDKSVPRY